MSEIEITTDRNRLDVDFVNGFISNAHWAVGRTKETMQMCMDNSINFGVYFQNKPVGYARVVTDRGIFAYIMDLFIDEKHRGKGYSKELMKFILEFEELKRVQVWRLSTSDAHKLYKKFGFKAVAKPEDYMELIVE